MGTSRLRQPNAFPPPLKTTMNNFLKVRINICNNFNFTWLHSFVLLILLNSIHITLSNPVFVNDPSLAQFQSGRNIRHLPCIVRKSGRSGVCMFAIDCIKQNGTHLGTCIDRFYFGSCCQIKENDGGNYPMEINDNSIDQNTISHFAHESTTLPTSALYKLTTESDIKLSNISYGSNDSNKNSIDSDTSTKVAIRPTISTEKYSKPPIIHTTTHKSSHFVIRTTTKPSILLKPSATSIIRKPVKHITTIKPILTTEKIKNQQLDQNADDTTQSTKFFTFQIVETTTPTIIETTKITNNLPTIETSFANHKRPISTEPISFNVSTDTALTPLKHNVTTTPIDHTNFSSIKTTKKPKPINRPTTTKKPQQTKRPSVETTKQPIQSTTYLTKRPATKPASNQFASNSTLSSSSTSSTHPAISPSTNEILANSTTITQKPKPTHPYNSHKPTIIKHKPVTESSISLSNTKPSSIKEEDTSPKLPQKNKTTKRPTEKPSRPTISNIISSVTTISSTNHPNVPNKYVTTKPLNSSKPDLITWTNADAEPTVNFPETDNWKVENITVDWIPLSTTKRTTISVPADSTTERVIVSISSSISEVLSNSSTHILKPTTTVTTSAPTKTTKPRPIATSASTTKKTTVTKLPPSTSTRPTTLSTFPVINSTSITVTTSKPIPITTTTTATTTTSTTITNPTLTPSTEETIIKDTTTKQTILLTTENGLDIDNDVSTSTDNYTDDPNISMETTTTSPLNSLEGLNYRQVCGRRMFPEARIVGGSNAAFGRWPWQISLRQWRTSTYLHKCGAALLNENWAITAAHCVDNVPPSDLLLRLGEYDLAEEEEPYGYQERRVQIVASHPQFDPRTFEYDLALLRFYEPVIFQPNIIPVCVPENDYDFIGQTAFVTGWGRLYEDGPLPSVLQEVAVPVINNTICESMYRAAGYIEHIPHIFICAGWKKGGYDSCEGDSGGPMVLQREEDKRFQLGGVISWGIGCAEANQPGVYTRISEFRDWINQILQF
ncbi:serine proteinase stubble-like [Teleopsis dalmanni]|uniref:serine proteinase stubble-like n=1 Tax=Teleopsis dalmanni TaxID=139649 RepID=UPI0018CCEAEB|nr:serine proteinase stubble-like [Teleopsis dalmanni]